MRNILKSMRSGQILSLFIVILAFILLLVAITMTIGNIALKRTNIVNVADNSALLIASHLGSYGNLLSTKYLKGGTKICEFSWTMLAKLVVGIILIVFAIILAIYTFTVAAPLVGWMIAAAVGLGIAGVLSVVTPQIAATQQGTAITRSFKKMGAKMRFEQTAVYTALTQLVDDPVKVVDIYDFDEDGLITDTIPRFTFKYTRWARLIADDIQTNLSELVFGDEAIPDFPFLTEAGEALFDSFDQLSSDLKNDVKDANELGILSKIVLAMPAKAVIDFFSGNPDQILEDYGACFIDFGLLRDEEGNWAWENFDFSKIPEFVSCLGKVYSDYLPTWIPVGYDTRPDGLDCSKESCAFNPCGDWDKIQEWLDGLVDCAQCTEVAQNAFYNDRIDRLIYDLDNFREFANSLGDALEGQDMSTIFASLDMWLPWIYDPCDRETGIPCDEDGDFYSLLYKDMESIVLIDAALLVAAAAEDLQEALSLGTYVSKSPEILAVMGRISGYGVDLLALTTAIRTFAQAVGKYLDMLGTNTYNWVDNRGRHTVSVLVSDFKVPYVKAYKKGCCTKCIKLKNYRNNIGVTVSRRDDPIDESLVGDGADLFRMEWRDVIPALTTGPKTGEVFFGNPEEGRQLWQFGEGVTSAGAGACYSYKVKKIRLGITDADKGLAEVVNWVDENYKDACKDTSDDCD